MAGVVFFGGWLLKCSYSIPLSSEPHCGSRLFSENSMLTTDNCFLTRRWPFGGFKKTFFLYFFQGKQNVILSSFSSSSVYINSTVHIGNEAPENHFETIEYAENWFCYHAKLSMYRLCVCVPVALHTVRIVAPFISESIILQPRKRMPYAIILGLVFSVSAAPGTVSLRQLQFFRIFVVFHIVVKQTRNVYITNDLLHIRIGLIGLLEACCDAYILPSLPCLWQWWCSWKGNFQSRDHSPRFES